MQTASAGISFEPIALGEARKDTARALAGALAFGVVTQALFWDATAGLNFALWTAFAVGAGVTFLRARGTRSTLPWVLGVAAVVASSAVALRASTWSLVLALPVTAAWLVLFGASLAGARAAELPHALLRVILSVPAGAVEAARAPVRAASPAARPVAARVGLGLLLGAPTAGLFALLLSSDTSFREALSRLGDRAGSAIGFVLAALATAFGALVARRMVRPPPARMPAWDDPLSAGPYRSVDDATQAVAARAVMTPLTWGLVLGQVALVFAVFAIANARHLFGGIATVRAERSLTYAAYVHSGFGELVVATLLSVGLVVVGHTLVTPLGERAARGGRGLAAVEGALLSLAVVVLASCAQRLLVYEDAYGATYLRLGVLVVEVGLGATLLATIVKVVRRSWSGYWVALALATLGVATSAALLDADGYVARTNLDRALAGKPLDEAYLGALGPDACAVLGHPAIAARDGLGARLREQWDTAREPDFRARRGVASCAR